MSETRLNLFEQFRTGQTNFTAQNPAMQGGNDAMQQAQQATGTGYMSNRVNASKDADPRTTLALTAGIGYGIGQAMDYFGPKCEGQYEKTIMGKLGAWGDNFSKNTKVGRFIERKLQGMSDWLTRKSSTSKIAYTLKHHSTSPSKGFPWDFARLPWMGIHGFLSMDTNNVMEQYMKPISGNQHKILGFFPGWTSNDYQKLEQYGKTQDYIENFKNSLNGKTKAQKALELQREELRCLGLPESEITKCGDSLQRLRVHARNLKVKVLGFDSLRQFKKVSADISSHPEEVMAAFEKATAGGKDFHISISRGSGLLGKIKSHFLGRKVSLSEYLNKYKATLGKVNTTHLGRALPKALGWLTEGCTNRYAGGKLAPFMQAFIFADMFYHTAKAPKGERGKTLIERFVNDFTYFIGATLGLIGLHKVGGWKYIGTDVAGREAYRAAQNSVNALNKVKGFANKAAHKAAKEAANAHLNVKGLKWHQKIMQKIGCIVNMGNEHFKPYLSSSKGNLNFLRRIANTNLIGVPLRLWLVMGVAMPFMVKAATKTAHLIFGRPTHSVLDEEEEEENDNQTQQTTNPQTQRIPTDPNKLADSNLIKQTVNGQRTAYQQQQNNNNINPQDGKDQENSDEKLVEPARSYIPSPIGYSKAVDSSAADIALSNADKAEQEINQIMASLKNF